MLLLLLLLMWLGNAAAEEPLVAATALGMLATLQPAGEAQLAGPDAALMDALGGHAQQRVENACEGGGGGVRKGLAEQSRRCSCCTYSHAVAPTGRAAAGTAGRAAKRVTAWRVTVTVTLAVTVYTSLFTVLAVGA